jgi:outer membrane lipoprotein-sorting protein
MKRILGIIFILVSTSSISAQNKLSAKEIMIKADELMRGVKTTKAEMTITSVRPKWTREMRMKTWSKGTKLSMILMTYPAKEKGTSFLMKDKEVWNWIPTIERTIKLPPSMMMQSWMGTDFTNDDLVKQSSIIEDYDHKILGDANVGNESCYKIELIPHEDAAVVWGKLIIFVSKKNFFQLRVNFYDEDEELVNVMKASNIKKLGGKLLPSKMEIIPQDKKGQKTIMEYTRLEFDLPIDDNFFTVQKMKRLK